MESCVKILMRIVHVGCACFVIGNTISDFVWEVEHDSSYIIAISVCGVLLLISGLVNLCLLKPSTTMGVLRDPWVFVVKLKFLFWVLLLPIPEVICKFVGLEFPRRFFNLVLVVLILPCSAYLKQYREWGTQANLSKLVSK